VAPLLPFVIVLALYPYPPYSAGIGVLIPIWLLGFLINYSLIITHELGHWLAARLVGVEVSDITIGHWRRLVSFSIKGVSVNLRTAPSTGYVTIKPSLKSLSAPRMVVVFLAGVFAEGVLITLFAVGLQAPENLYSVGDLFVAFCRINIVFVGSYHTLINLLPTQTVVGGEKRPSDGFQLIHLWKSRHERLVQRRLLSELQQVDDLCLEGKFQEALEVAYTIANKHPDNIGLWQFIGTVHEKLGQMDKAESVLRELIKRPSVPVLKLAELLDSLSSMALYYGRTEMFAEADAWTNEAFRYAPNAITLKGTRGGVLIELGRIDEGISCLREVIKRSECPSDQAFGTAYLAKAFAVKGDHEESSRWMAKAQALNANHPLVKRIAGELSIPSAAPIT
jgi:tetratricopeptide (TPR) repeat protein